MAQERDADQIGMADVVSIHHVDRKTVRQMIEAGELDYVVKLSGRTGAYVFSRRAVAEAFERHPRRRYRERRAELADTG